MTSIHHTHVFIDGIQPHAGYGAGVVVDLGNHDLEDLAAHVPVLVIFFGDQRCGFGALPRGVEWF